MAASTKTAKKTTAAKKSVVAKKSPAAKTSRVSKKHQAAPALAAHGRAIDALHKKLGALQDAGDAKGKANLKKAVDKYKKAHGTFVDDVLYCMPSG